MTRRITKKRAALFSAVVLSVPLAHSHAKPSFWRLDRGGQRYHLRRVLVEKLGLTVATATRAAHLWYAARPTGDAEP